MRRTNTFSSPEASRSDSTQESIGKAAFGIRAQRARKQRSTSSASRLTMVRCACWKGQRLGRCKQRRELLCIIQI